MVVREDARAQRAFGRGYQTQIKNFAKSTSVPGLGNTQALTEIAVLA